ncbi:YdaU family protein [Bordetella genomosp. 7]|uniref:YdaU family protein n=1 Tax=Bordetella genomosp. 7 TaxID=1416805 RepID=UPI00201611A2|nr:YdaU family protein [Bordetella genomosp. 7]
MNYYSHNIGDYAQATMHLSLIEDAIYSRLLRRYYSEEQPIVDDIQQVCRWVGARTQEEREAVPVVLAEFFVLKDGFWHNKRADEEIAAYQAKSAKAADSAAKRWAGNAKAKPTECDGSANAMRTHSEGNANQEPITNNQETNKEHPPTPRKRGRSNSAPAVTAADLESLGVPADVATEFLALRARKRAPLTEVALAGVRREAEKAGWTLDQTLRKCIERGWQGFEADWVKANGATTGATRHGNFAEQDYRAGVEADGSF